MIQIAEAWRRAVWTPGSALPPTVVTHLRAWETAVRAFGRDLVLLRASALTYRTLLSLVPFLAVSFALLGSFGGLQNAEEALRRRLLQTAADLAHWDRRALERGGESNA